MTELKIFLKPGIEFLLEPPMVSRPAIQQLISDHGIKIVESPTEADWIVVPRLRSALPFQAKFPWKRILVFTNEPRFSNSCQRQKKTVPFLAPIEIMGVFTGDVFWHNYHYLGSCHYDTGATLDVDIYHPLPLLTSRVSAPSLQPIAAFISYRLDTNTSWVIDGIERDLERPRATHTLALHQAGLCDVYGSNWPAGVATESSGYMTDLEKAEPWWVRKMRILAGYRYNLCVENSASDYYCTEKIWQAIQAGTLPIYWGANNKIYELFPKNSFIDLADFASPAHLVDFIKALPESEYLDRNNQCREVFNRCIAERRDTIAADPALHLDHFLARVRS